MDTSKPPTTTVLRSQPWWQTVRAFAGRGPMLLPGVRLSPSAIQVRVRWSCRRGRLRIRSAARSAPLVDGSCGGAKTKTTLVAARNLGRLRVAAVGPWTARVDQQVDVPLVEPPLRAMRTKGARVIASGSFYRIDQFTQGRVTVYRLSGHRYALRLSGFYVTPNSDLQLRLSGVRAPGSTREYLSAPSTFAAPLDVTAGTMNVVLPKGTHVDRARSLVVWCAGTRSAYAAATLKAAR